MHSSAPPRPPRASAAGSKRTRSERSLAFRQAPNFAFASRRFPDAPLTLHAQRAKQRGDARTGAQGGVKKGEKRVDTDAAALNSDVSFLSLSSLSPPCLARKSRSGWDTRAALPLDGKRRARISSLSALLRPGAVRRASSGRLSLSTKHKAPTCGTKPCAALTKPRAARSHAQHPRSHVQHEASH